MRPIPNWILVGMVIAGIVLYIMQVTGKLHG